MFKSPQKIYFWKVQTTEHRLRYMGTQKLFKGYNLQIKISVNIKKKNKRTPMS